MQSEMGGLISRHGGVPYAAPVLQEIYDTGTPEVTELISDLCAGRLQIVVLQTGVGTRALFEAAGPPGRQGATAGCFGSRHRHCPQPQASTRVASKQYPHRPYAAGAVYH